MQVEVLRPLIDSGKNVREISESVGKSQTTVVYWLKKHGLFKPHSASISSEKHCTKCATTKPSGEFYTRRDGANLSAYCKPCSGKQTLERQREYKRQCVAYKGGECEVCGYRKYLGALEFHHLDPSQKDFAPSNRKSYAFDDVTMRELDKCILVCANCHRELHGEM